MNITQPTAASIYEEQRTVEHLYSLEGSSTREYRKAAQCVRNIYDKIDPHEFESIDACIEYAVLHKNHFAFAHYFYDKSGNEADLFSSALRQYLQDRDESFNAGVFGENTFILKNSAFSCKVGIADDDSVYAYQLKNGIRDFYTGKSIPKRDYIIQTGLNYRLSAEEVNRLLRLAGYPALYVNSIVDFVSYFYLEHKELLPESETVLYQEAVIRYVKKRIDRYARIIEEETKHNRIRNQQISDSGEIAGIGPADEHIETIMHNEAWNITGFSRFMSYTKLGEELSRDLHNEEDLEKYVRQNAHLFSLNRYGITDLLHQKAYGSEALETISNKMYLFDTDVLCDSSKQSCDVLLRRLHAEEIIDRKRQPAADECAGAAREFKWLFEKLIAELEARLSSVREGCELMEAYNITDDSEFQDHIGLFRESYQKCTSALELAKQFRYIEEDMTDEGWTVPDKQLFRDIQEVVLGLRQQMHERAAEIYEMRAKLLKTDRGKELVEWGKRYKDIDIRSESALQKTLKETIQVRDRYARAAEESTRDLQLKADRKKRKRKADARELILYLWNAFNFLEDESISEQIRVANDDARRSRGSRTSFLTFLSGRSTGGIYRYENPSIRKLVKCALSMGQENLIEEIIIRSGCWDRRWINERSCEGTDGLSRTESMVIYAMRYRDRIISMWNDHYSALQLQEIMACFPMI